MRPRIGSLALAAAGLAALAVLAACTATAHAVLPPTVEITSAPSSELKTHKRLKPATFSFASDNPLATFTCRLDTSGYLPCASPVTVYLRAGKGKGTRHTFFVRSADPEGYSSGVAVRSLRVQRVKPYKR